MIRIGIVLVVLLAFGPDGQASAEPDVIVEKSLKEYCEKNRIDRAKIDPFTLDLIPGTQTFRYVLPPLEAPPERPYAGLPARFAFLIVDAKSGKIIEIKAARYDHSVQDSTPELFAAMKAAGVKINTAADATRVLRILFFLDRASGSTKFKLEDANRITSDGRNPQRPDLFGGGVHCWTRGDFIGLSVDKDDFPAYMVGGHVR